MCYKMLSKNMTRFWYDSQFPNCCFHCPLHPYKRKNYLQKWDPPCTPKEKNHLQKWDPPLAPLKKKIFGRDTEDFLNWKILNWRKQTLSTDKNIAEMPSSSDHRGFSTLLCVPNYFIDMTSILWPRHYTAD